ncbi:hypothetical protein ABPG77_007366 [Micractinium sp. CCAP 211/92]
MRWPALPNQSARSALPAPPPQLDLSHWQVVWRYSDYQATRLGRVEGAIALSVGSPAGALVRLVDTFSSDGVPGGAGFSAAAAAAAANDLSSINSACDTSLGLHAWLAHI